jgi:hypothetical protein
MAYPKVTSVLAPMLFNIYTDDQPTIIKETKHYLYANDLALAVQDTTSGCRNLVFIITFQAYLW